jgi:aminoglycoside phosphotransferase (APT) family kinase protein
LTHPPVAAHDPAVEEALAKFLTPRLGVTNVAVTDMQRIPGGASRETWMFDAHWADSAGAEHVSEFILQKDAAMSLVESERAIEFAFYQTMHAAGIPVPQALWLEPGPEPLGQPFFIMERLADVEASPTTILSPAWAEARPRVAIRMYEILGAIHRAEWQGTAIASAVEPPAPETTAERELLYWEDIIDRHELSPQPIARAAIRWLRANPPPPAPLVAVVHGDYRVGNVLYRDSGEIAGVVDWEMAHLGNPLEDLAWSFLETWEWARDGRKGGIIDEAEALALYEAASGIKVDLDALHWWDVFNGVKAQGIWLTSAHAYQSGGSNEPVLAMTPYWLTNFQDEMLLRSLGRFA